MTAAVLLLLAVFVCAWAATGRYRRYALHHGIVDHPNHRSSHVEPTARGGGVAIVATVLAAIGALSAAGRLEPRLAAALAGGGALVAWIGWVDDRGGVSSPVRAAVHFAAAGWAVWLLGGMPRLVLGPWAAHPGAAGAVLATLGIVWVLNLYNFMDGIDGIAAGQAVVAGVGGGVLFLLGGRPGPALFAFAVAAGSLGFLRWNWAPARIFMGDVGSGFLGYLFAVLGLASENLGAAPLMAWVILLGVFVFDATVTLVRRLMHGERWYAAHRSHAYQRAAQRAAGHGPATAGALALAGVMAVLAAVGARWPALLLPAFAAAAVLLAAVYLRIEAAHPMHPRRGAAPATTETRARR